MSFIFINNSIENISNTFITNDNKKYKIKENDNDKILNLIRKYLKNIIKLYNVPGAADLQFIANQFKIFRLVIFFIKYKNNENNEDNNIITSIFQKLKGYDENGLLVETIIKAYTDNNKFDYIYNLYKPLIFKSDHNSPIYTTHLTVFKHFLYMTKDGDYTVGSDGNLVANTIAVTQVPAVPVAPGSSGYSPETDPCFINLGFYSNRLPSNFFNNLLVEKKDTGYNYYYNNKEINDCMEVLIEVYKKDKGFKLNLEQKRKMPTQFPGITEEDKKEIKKTTDNIFKLEKFNESLNKIHTTLHEFLKNITDLKGENSYEYHLLKIESFLVALERFEKKIKIKPFEHPKKVNLQDIKVEKPTTPISKENLEKIEIKHSSSNKLLGELKNKDNFKKIEELLYGEKHEKYLTDLNKMNYNNGKVLYNSMSLPNTYNNGIYSYNSPSNLSNMQSNYGDPITMEILKPLISAFSSDADITRNSNFSQYSKWMRDYPDIRRQLIEYFANESPEQSFDKLRNFAVSMYNICKNTDTSDLFKDTGYYDSDVSGVPLNDPLSITAFVNSVYEFQDKNLQRDANLENYFKKVVNTTTSKALWTNKKEKEQAFFNLLI